jgi:hypothetical protein
MKGNGSPSSLCCAKCGCQSFKFVCERRDDRNVVGSICSDCGTALTEDDISEYVRKLGVRAPDSFLTKAGMKRVG